MDNLTAGNPVAHRVRVYYTGDDALKEGEPLCYSFKTTKNWWGGSVSDEGVVTASVTAAEGTQNASKYMSVESPLRLSLSSDTPADGSKTITGSTTDFDTLHVGMFVSISGTDVTNGNYEITAISRSTESGVTNSTITLGNMTAATGTTADVATAIDNISAFAGVVARGGWVGKTGPRVIDIYVPNGAVVPVRNDQNCVLGKTILAVHTNEQHLTAPHRNYALPVAIAWETVDTATTTGLVLAKLDSRIFIRQEGDAGVLEIDDEDTTSDIVVNRMKVKSLQTGGQFTVLHIQAESAAGAGTINQRGMALKTEAILSATNAASVHANTMALEITGGTPIEYLFPLQVKLYESGATLTSIACMGVLNLCCQVTAEPGGNDFCWIYAERHGARTPDSFIRANAKGDLSDTAMTGDHAFDTADRCIPVRFQASSEYFYIPLMNNKGD